MELAIKKIGFLIAILLILTGCTRSKNPDDPYESFNRKMFNFNRGVDTVVFKPVAFVYYKALPTPIRMGASNAFDNLNMPTVFLNDVLQGEFRDAMADFWRMAINSTAGIAGLFDVATKLGLGPRDNDFGKTLAVWGVKKSPYLVLPIVGSTTARDFAGITIDQTVGTPWLFVDPQEIYYALESYRIMQFHTFNLAADQYIKEAFDPYVFVRNAYLQKRQGEITQKDGTGSPDHFVDRETPTATTTTPSTTTKASEKSSIPANPSNDGDTYVEP